MIEFNTSTCMKLKNKGISSPQMIFRYVFVTVIIIPILCIFIFPSISFRVGNIFFGNYPSLYNVNLAQFLYKQSVSPLLHQPIPQYAHHQLSRTYFIQGDLWGALDEAKEELKLHPQSTSTYYILGLTYGYMNRNHEAIDAFSVYIDNFPGAWAPRNDKAWLQFRIGDIDEALKTMQPIVNNFKYTVWVQNTYCALLISKKDFSNAKIACERAQKSINKMDENDWGRAYPGNDPRIYGTGLNAMKRSIESNLAIINKNLSK